MLSFIIIGRNEGWKLSQCFLSVFHAVEQNKIKNFEVIYVDSKSTDNSVDLAKSFLNIKSFQITGVCNAAIARNIGAKESSGDTLFFIDGDMEIQPDFLPLVYSESLGLKYEFVSGQWINYNYNYKGQLILKEEYSMVKYFDRYTTTTGGLFIIKKELWKSIGGMKSKMKVNEDLDLGLRLSKNNHKLFRKRELLAIHHTIPYNDKKRIWNTLFKGHHLFRIVLLRNNLININAWKLFLRGNYTFVILLFSILISILFTNPFFILLYWPAIISRTLLRKDKSIRLFFTNIIYFPLYEMSLLFGFFIFWPKNQKIEYVAIKFN